MTINAATNGLQFLRPFLFRATPSKHKLCYIRLFNTTSCHYSSQSTTPKKSKLSKQTDETRLKLVTETSDVEERVAVLTKADALNWPRIHNTSQDVTVKQFLETYNHVNKGQTLQDKSVVLHGRVKVIRTAGKSLAFLDIVHDHSHVQVMCNFGRLSAFSNVSQAGFRDFFRLLQRGDFVCETSNDSLVTYN
jgi:lysyl-tRNA synthetase class II